MEDMDQPVERGDSGSTIIGIDALTLAVAINDAQILGPEWWGKDLVPVAEKIISKIPSLDIDKCDGRCAKNECICPSLDVRPMPMKYARALEDYIEQLEPPRPVSRSYGLDPKEAFEVGFYWCMDAIYDYLEGEPWTGGFPKGRKEET
jgi:hypothetical protein